jgi:hypothetical protein
MAQKKSKTLIFFWQPTDVKQKLFFASSLIPGNLWIFLMIWRETFISNESRVISLFDDALISMSYARTFSQTGDLIWFPGAEKVQGITNPLWTFLLSGFHLFSNNSQTVIILVIFLNLIVINSVSIVVYLILKKVLPFSNFNQKIMLGVTASIPFQYSFVYWTIRGLEVGMLSLILLLTLLTIVNNEKLNFRKYILISLFGIVGTLTRFDYLLIQFSIITYLMYKKKFIFLIASNNLIKLSLYIPLIFTSLVVLLWQKIYYGEYLPNTYYLKVVGFDIQDRIIRGFASVLKSYLMPVFFILTTRLILKSTRNSKITQFFYLSCTVIIAVLCYVIYIGGDAWEVFGKINRFISVIQPLYLILMGIGISLFLNSDKRFRKSFLLVYLVFFISILAYGIRLNPFRYSLTFPIVVTLVFVIFYILILKTPLKNNVFILTLVFCIISSNTLAFGSWFHSGARDGMDSSDSYNFQIANDINSILKSQGKAAVLFAGAPIYFSQRKGIDLLGKNDRIIARQKPNFKNHVGQWNSSFYPGHNKWDFEHSIGELRADMVAQTWGNLEIADFGYKKFCLIDSGRSYYLNPSSNLINWEKVIDC